MRQLRSLLNQMPHRKTLLRVLERELDGRGVRLGPCDLERLREELLQYPKPERSGLAAALAELLRRVREQGELFAPREQDGFRGRKWSADYADAFIMEEVCEWMFGRVRAILARGEDYAVEVEPGEVVVTAGPADFDGEVPDGFEIIETAHLERMPVINIVPRAPPRGA
jgi:hypothetical protein